METYSLPSWSVRRVGGELKEWLEEQSGAVSWGESIWSPPLLAFKVLTTGGAYVMPDKPGFEQLDPLDREVGSVLDMVENWREGKKRIKPIGLEHPPWFKGLARMSLAGVVFIWPAFYGYDP